MVGVKLQSLVAMNEDAAYFGTVSTTTAYNTCIFIFFLSFLQRK